MYYIEIRWRYISTSKYDQSTIWYVWYFSKINNFCSQDMNFTESGGWNFFLIWISDSLNHIIVDGDRRGHCSAVKLDLVNMTDWLTITNMIFLYAIGIVNFCILIAGTSSRGQEPDVPDYEIQHDPISKECKPQFSMNIWARFKYVGVSILQCVLWS